MLNFEERIGPDLGAAAPVYPGNTVPDWYRDAKLGCFVHWGIYSVPAWATPPAEIPVPDADPYAHHQYAEWYANTVRIAGSPTWRHHQERYGVGTSYEDLADRWQPDGFAADTLVGELADAGARYIVPTTKHHDGFCLWATRTTDFNAARRGPRRDLIRELHEATRRNGLRFGVYFSGALDWHAGDFPPIRSDADLFAHRRNDPWFSRYAADQLDELISATSPDLLWNDIDWPDGGKGAGRHGLAALLGRYFAAVPHGVINDRWGIPYHGFLTREYTLAPGILAEPWEATRGLGSSFGYNQLEDEAGSLSGTELIRLLVTVVSRNGNLLLNVGPRADGTIPGLQRRALGDLGGWLRRNGHAVYGTRPWIRDSEPTGVPRAYTTSPGLLHLHVLDPGAGLVELPAEVSDARLEGLARWTDGFPLQLRHQPDGSLRAEVPAALRGDAVAVLTLPARLRVGG